ncbi:MAG TPA: hypothetical protein VM619_01775 [Luteimonas sp.]|nr:hypothetical protein [Luteimonas sp.]
MNADEETTPASGIRDVAQAGRLVRRREPNPNEPHSSIRSIRVDP